jgi:hypothetical protein
MEASLSAELELLRRMYAHFNARDLERTVAAMHEDVVWANGMDGGYEQGRQAVRSYWTRQWAIIDPHVEPLHFSAGPDGEIVVEVHQTVRDLGGNILADKRVGHIFRIEGGLIRRFDIRQP